MVGRITSVVLLLASSVVIGDEPPIPDTQSASDISLSPQESLSRMEVPPGFHVTLFAGEPDIRRPIAFDFDDRGRLWVVENYSHPNWKPGKGVDRIVILEDVDADGRFDRRKIFWDQGRYLTAIAVGHGGVWIGNTPELAFIPDRDGDDVPDSEPIVKLDGFQVGNKNNCLNNFHWGPDGWLYGAVGLANKSWIGPPGSPKSERTLVTRCIWRYHPIHGTFDVLARGMVNPWGADFNAYGDLFTSNTVIAHLWHIVPGMYCQRRGNERDNPYVYVRIQSIADHLHWAGGRWQASRDTSGHHDDAGGGHAHCGGMVYLGDNFPEAYRGTFFTGNLHGSRLNNEQLVPRNSTYVGTHRPDFLHANDPWFRSLTQKYGPDGGVYVSDWHDLGECHDADGSHRSSGRIYKVVHGVPTSRPRNLAAMSSEQLVSLHEHDNEWFVRHARRILQERQVAGQDQRQALRPLQLWLDDTAGESVLRLRALWTLFVTRQVSPSRLHQLTIDADEHLRRWAIRLLVDREPGEEAIRVIARRASDPSPAVRLAVASALRRIPAEDRWGVISGLIQHREDAADPYLPAMIWYGLEPLVMRNPERSLKLVAGGQIPLLPQLVARRLMDNNPSRGDELVALLLRDAAPSLRSHVLLGMAEGISGRPSRVAPDGWNRLYQELQATGDAAIQFRAAQLATAFGDSRALAALRDSVLNSELSIEQRRTSLRAILEHGGDRPRDLLHQLVQDAALRPQALAALESCANVETAQLLLDRYAEFSVAEKSLAIAALAANRTTAAKLVTAVAANNVPRRDISAYDLQRLRSFSDASLRQRLDSIWDPQSKAVAKSDQIAHYKAKLTDAVLQAGDASAGRKLFEQTCAKCHQLFGEGSTLAPDLTGSGRKNLDYLLSNLIDPNGLVDPAYRLTTAITTEGRVLQGFIIQLTEQAVTLRTQSGQVILPLKDVEELATNSISMMPEGLLQTYTDEQVRDLVKYLMSSEPAP